jgi:hypothetical protein
MVAVVVVEISGDGNGEMINRDLPGGDGSDECISIIDGRMELGGCGQVNNEVVVIGTYGVVVMIINNHCHCFGEGDGFQTEALLSSVVVMPGVVDASNGGW